MLQLLLIIVSLKVLFSLSARKRRKAADYPEVSPDQFRAWHEADLRFAKGFPLIAVGGFVAQNAVAFITVLIYGALSSTFSADTAKVIWGVSAFVVFLISVGWIHTLYSTAAEKKKEAGIEERTKTRKPVNPPFLADISMDSHSAPAEADAGAPVPTAQQDSLVAVQDGGEAQPSAEQSENLPSGY